MMRFSGFQARQYISYLLTARTKYYIHSPFVYELCESVIYDSRQYYAFETIEQLRNKMLKSEQIIEVTDYGAGSALTAQMGTLRRVQDIARYAATPPKIGQLLFRLVNHLQPAYMLELGTSVGIGTLYMWAANQRSTIYTIEGCPQTALIAQQNFTTLKAQNINLITGNFDQVLPATLEQLPQLDFAYFDGNHRLDPTLHYFETCLPKTHHNTVLVFDDIHLSPQMLQAWRTIQNHPAVTLTIDLFKVGLVFFRQGIAKENFVMYY